MTRDQFGGLLQAYGTLCNDGARAYRDTDDGHQVVVVKLLAEFDRLLNIEEAAREYLSNFRCEVKEGGEREMICSSIESEYVDLVDLWDAMLVNEAPPLTANDPPAKCSTCGREKSDPEGRFCSNVFHARYEMKDGKCAICNGTKEVHFDYTDDETGEEMPASGACPDCTTNETPKPKCPHCKGTGV